ncbi:hypothetical protein PsAD2_00678 [Pseudovibrio axinellae]|uniref:EBNA-1 nuclear protein n=1 Tax=Pseudovibrio axinellae TaxID=989403 RepID=A0A166APJ7_9HYPH|nr:N-acetyltransferase DgcN [Pseudovibrio axinellae]KZL21387.1 hypothetical protein PsAD2_00678 [Pseudovibrio axinellae]SEQ98334.1 Uncharacterized conserved protein, NAD-dependent epimerase/dehydratase family [Pseudovibrio axinellae]
MTLSKPYLLFLGDAKDELAAKTAHGIADWRADWCVGQLSLPGCKAHTNLPEMTPVEAAKAGAKTMVIGCVNAGGVLPEIWIEPIVTALNAGLDVATGLHIRLSSIPQVKDAAAKNNCKLHDLRFPELSLPTGSGSKRLGKRLLTVGTDCSVGKKYSALALQKEFTQRNISADFCATGQTGILIAERGIAIDAIVSDFISGAAEHLSPANKDNHWDIIEGQGSLLHPSYAGVCLGLLHGSQPDVFVICHEPTRATMRGVLTPIPSIKEIIDLTMRLGRITNPNIQCGGLAINTMMLSENHAKNLIEELAEEHKLPATDPVRFGAAQIIDHICQELKLA